MWLSILLTVEVNQFFKTLPNEHLCLLYLQVHWKCGFYKGFMEKRGREIVAKKLNLSPAELHL